jgi:hypothetical protein
MTLRTLAALAAAGCGLLAQDKSNGGVDPEAHLYEIPWPAGRTYPVLAGNGEGGTHQGEFLHSWDFSIPVGDVVCAARGGVVMSVRDSGADGRGLGITIDHGDGTLALYGHLMRGGILVKRGERVLTGEPIAKIGPEAGGASPHLHFHVTTSERIRSHMGAPVASNFKGPDGKAWRPKRGEAPTSKNAAPANLSEHRKLRRTHPILQVAVGLKAHDLAMAAYRRVSGIDRSLGDKDPNIAEALEPYGDLSKPPEVDGEALKAIDSALQSKAYGRAFLIASLAAQECRTSKLSKEFKTRLDEAQSKAPDADKERAKKELKAVRELVAGLEAELEDAFDRARKAYERAVKAAPDGPLKSLADKLRSGVTADAF